MKKKLDVPAKRALADFLPRVTIAAKTLANEMTEHNLTEKDIVGEEPITDEHISSNSAVRSALVDRGITPEKLPPEEDVKKLERRVKSQDKKLPKSSQGFK